LVQVILSVALGLLTIAPPPLQPAITAQTVSSAKAERSEMSMSVFPQGKREASADLFQVLSMDHPAQAEWRVSQLRRALEQGQQSACTRGGSAPGP
jgi:hypothetical protein